METHPLDYHDTPRVNAFLRKEHVAADAMWAEFAAQLERENATLREDKARLDRLQAAMYSAPDWRGPAVLAGWANLRDVRQLIDRNLPA